MLSFTLLLLFTFSCDRENFELIEETELPEELVVFEELSPIYFRTVLNDRDTSVSNGIARYDRATRQIAISGIENTAFSCPSSGSPGLGWMIDGSGIPIVIYGQLDESENYESGFAMYSDFLTEENILVTTTHNCADVAVELRLDTILNEVSGSLSGSMIDFEYGFPTPEACDTITLYPVTVDFRIPLTYCE